MIINKEYVINGLDCDIHRSELQPNHLKVKCIKNMGNKFFIIKLIDNLGKKMDKTITIWLINCNITSYYSI